LLVSKQSVHNTHNDTVKESTTDESAHTDRIRQ